MDAGNFNILHAILQASFIVQLALFFLIFMSIYSWTVFFFKKRQFRKIQADNKTFQEQYQKASSLESIANNTKLLTQSSLAHIFTMGYKELQKLAAIQPSKGLEEAKTYSSHLSHPHQLSGIDNLERCLRQAMDEKITLMESKLYLLSIIASTAPFIGLLGTIWGIINAFHKIGLKGSASLAVVAPGISEALFATAIGLFAAIPAVIFYNYFQNILRKEENHLSDFSIDFLNTVRRNFFQTNPRS